MLGALITMMVFGALFVMLPLLLIAGVLKLVVGLVFLPFRILGGLLHAAFAIVGLAFKAVFSVVGFLAFFLFGFIFLVALPLAPLLLFGAFVWAIVKAFSAPVARVV